MKYILELGEPLVRTYPQHTNLFSILSRNSIYLDWFYSHFAALSCPETFPSDFDKIVNYFSYDQQYPFYEGSPFVSNYSEDRCSSAQIVDKLLDHIEQGRYIAVYLNDFYVPYRNFSEDYYHDLMIYGFDSSEGQFEVLGFDGRGYPSRQQLAFSDLIEAYRSTNNALEDNKLPFYMKKDWIYEFNENVSIPFDRNRFQFLLKCHQKSQSFAFETEDNYIFGMNVYDSLLEHLQMVEKHSVKLDHRAFYLIWEHKKIMNDRLRYMYLNHFADHNQSLLHQAELILNKAQIIRNLTIRARVVSGSISTIAISEKCKEMREMEERFIEDIMKA
ncbi:hypothetical protein [Paenibacillus humicus]|uniref:hypothetical protein n=1 Tax=Paenibacillus humicus TaxID=412861 RepID=UPI000FDA59C8|nr:hypothetical protein [Paenibacillus humicus]